jgi:hypothetical protein
MAQQQHAYSSRHTDDKAGPVLTGDAVQPNSDWTGEVALDRQIRQWCARDLNDIRAAWDRVRASHFSPSSMAPLHLATHNLFGASALYGGEALICLSRTLQSLCRCPAVLTRYPQLTDLLIGACVLCANSGDETLDTDQIRALCRRVDAQLLRAPGDAG